MAAAGRGRQGRRSSTSCTAWPANGASPSSHSTGCPATRVRARCGSATPPTSSSSSTSSARSWTLCTWPAAPGVQPTATPGVWKRELLDFPGVHLASAGRRHLGGARPATALHPFQGHGLGGVRSRGQGQPRPSAWTVQSSAGGQLRDAIHAEVCREGFDAELGAFVAVLRLEGTGREPADDGAVGFLPAQRSAHARHGRGDRAAPDARRVRCPLRSRERRRRAAARRGGVSALHLLARRQLRAPRAATPTPAGSSSACSRSGTTSACFPRSTTRSRRRLLGNFPQAFSHVALVNTARNLAQRGGPAEHRQHD